MFLRILAQRIATVAPVVLVVITGVFFLFAVIPGDPAQLLAGEQAPQDAVNAIRVEFGLDKPVHIRYMVWMAHLLRGDLGRSIFTGRPVFEELAPMVWNTMELAAVSIVIAITVGLTTGILSAVRPYSLFDRMATLTWLGGISIPGFWLALMLIYFFAVRLHLLPTSGKGEWQHFVMPAVTLSFFSTAFIARMTRSALLDVIRQDYIRTARAKGLPNRLVILNHGLRNALIPIVTVVGLRFGYMLGGAVITETIFAWPGLGRVIVQSVGYRDYPMIQGALLIFATTFVVLNALVDLSYAFLDPKIRY